MRDNYIIDRIYQICESKNMTQYELAKRAGLTQSSLSNLMSQGCKPTIKTLEKICNGFGITLAQFFANDRTYPDLSGEQKKLLDEWESLSPREKQVALKMINNIKELR